MVNDPFRALSHPIRRGIVERLASGPATVGETTAGFGVSKPAISKHLKVLEHANLISRGREAQWRPCRIAPAALKDVDGWLERYRKFWDENFDRLDDYLQEMKAQEANGKSPNRTKSKPRKRGRKV